jgi:uncharacterized protein YjbJ (UPF0337 family)
MVDQAKGRVEQAVGRVSGDRGQQMRGAVDEAIGKLEQAIGEVRAKGWEALKKPEKPSQGTTGH